MFKPDKAAKTKSTKLIPMLMNVRETLNFTLLSARLILLKVKGVKTGRRMRAGWVKRILRESRLL